MVGEALDGLLNANLAWVTVRQNVIIQQVSAWAAIAAVATIITGIYGRTSAHAQSRLGVRLPAGDRHHGSHRRRTPLVLQACRSAWL